MKILMVGTSAHGGAGIAARRQMEALNGLGHDCQFLSLREDWAARAPQVVHQGKELTLVLPGADASFNSALAAAYCQNNRTSLSTTWFSLWPSRLAVDDLVAEASVGFDVVHLHWVSHFVSSATLRTVARRGQRLVVTGHDMNYFTGGCHYSAGCTAYIQACTNCPQLVSDPLSLVAKSWAAKLEAFSDLAVGWVFPSEWLAGCFRASALGAWQADVHVIRNSIDGDEWRPARGAEREALRAGSGFAPTDIVLVAGAQDNAEKRKGFDLMETALRDLQPYFDSGVQRRQVQIVTFGGGKPRIAITSPWLTHLHLGPVNEERVAALLRAADLLLFPSREENFSNTILEALMCACPVLGLAIGGVPEIVQDGVNGVVVASPSQGAFTAALQALLEPGRLAALRESTLAWRDAHAASFSGQTVAHQLVAVYEAAPSVPQPTVPPVTSSVLWPTINELAFSNDFAEREATLADLRRLVQAPAQAGQGPFLVGFGAPEAHETWGQVRWIKATACVAFGGRTMARPSLLLQLPNHPEPINIMRTALPNLRMSFNGQEIGARVISVRPQARFAYLAFDADAALLDEGGLNEFVIRFSALTVPLEADRRGLCLLVSGAMVVDRDSLAGVWEDEQTASAACLELGPLFGFSTHDSNLLRRCSASAWVDLMDAARSGIDPGQESGL